MVIISLFIGKIIVFLIEVGLKRMLFMSYLFYNRLKDLVESSGKSANQIEKELGYSRNTLSNYKRVSEPSGTRLFELSEYFNVSPKYLIGLTDERFNFSAIRLGDAPNLSSTVNIFKSLTQEEKKEMCIICQKWLFLENLINV